MGETTRPEGQISSPGAIKRPVNGRTARLVAFALAGLVTCSALSYALVKERPAVDETTIAGPAVPGGGGPAPQPGVSVSSASPALPAPETDATAAISTEADPSTPEDMAMTAPAEPAPERFGAPDPATQAVLDTHLGPDGERLPIIADSDAEAPVEFAGTEQEVVAMEERLAAAGDPNFVLPPSGEADAVEVAEAATDPADEADVEESAMKMSSANADGVPGDGPWSDLVRAKAARYVNLRDAPAQRSKVIEVVPAGAPLSVQAACSRWCAVIHDGTRGYIYHTFIHRRQA